MLLGLKKTISRAKTERRLSFKRQCKTNLYLYKNRLYLFYRSYIYIYRFIDIIVPCESVPYKIVVGHTKGKR